MSSNNVYPLKATASEDARAALAEIRAEKLRIAYAARRGTPPNVAPEVIDVTPRRRMSVFTLLGYTVAWIVTIVALAFIAGS